MFQEFYLTEFNLRKSALLKSIEGFDFTNSSNEEITDLLNNLNGFHQIVSAYKFNLDNKHKIDFKSEENNSIQNQETETISIHNSETSSVKNESVSTKKNELEISEEPAPVDISRVEQKTIEIAPEITNPDVNSNRSITTDPKSTPEITNSVPESINQPLTSNSSNPTKNIRKIEFGINDKFRIINELFGQSQIEFNTAVEQLNTCLNLEESENYLNNLKMLYNWKSESPLVKTFFAINHKRFS